MLHLGCVADPVSSGTAADARDGSRVRRLLRIWAFARTASAVGPLATSPLVGRSRDVEIEGELGKQGAQPFSRRGPPRLRDARLSINSVSAAISAALDVTGVVGTLSCQVAGHLERDCLVEILTDENAPPVPVLILLQSGRRDTPNIRAFVNLARERLRGDL